MPKVHSRRAAVTESMRAVFDRHQSINVLTRSRFGPSPLVFAVAIAAFILANIGRDLVILTRESTNTLVAVSIVSIVLNPLRYRLRR